jgi:signal transduction histidine kinase
MGSTQETAVTAGIKELAEVFSTQLAQSIENIRMFEQTFNAQRELERRVRERTGELQNTMRDLTEANKRKTEFVSAVSHEFRTPLTSIKGYAALLAGGKFGELPAEISTRLNRINEQADALVGMINDLLDIARIESGRVQVQMQRIDFCEAVRTQADMFFPQLNEKQLNLHLDIPEHATVDGDKQMLQRVVMNLLSNAVKFTPSGRNIYLAVKEQGAQYRVSVKDEGIGIPAADLENVFKEFFRVNTAEHRAVKGTGLGLSLVVNIVRAHKGKVWVESDTGKGAEFIFLLPKETATADAVAG